MHSVDTSKSFKQAAFELGKTPPQYCTFCVEGFSSNKFNMHRISYVYDMQPTYSRYLIWIYAYIYRIECKTLSQRETWVYIYFRSKKTCQSSLAFFIVPDPRSCYPPSFHRFHSWLVSGDLQSFVSVLHSDTCGLSRRRASYFYRHEAAMCRRVSAVSRGACLQVSSKGADHSRF